MNLARPRPPCTASFTDGVAHCGGVASVGKADVEANSGGKAGKSCIHRPWLNSLNSTKSVVVPVALIAFSMAVALVLEARSLRLTCGTIVRKRWMTVSKELAVWEVRRWTNTGSVVVIAGSDDMLHRDPCLTSA